MLKGLATPGVDCDLNGNPTHVRAKDDDIGLYQNAMELRNAGCSSGPKAFFVGLCYKRV